MAAGETRAKIIEKLQEDLANCKAIEANHHEKLEQLSEKIEGNHSQVNHNISTLDKKCDGLGAAIEMLSLQISKAVERMESYNRDRPILGSASPLEQQYHQTTSFMGTSSQIHSSGGIDPKFPRPRTEVEYQSCPSGNYRFDFPRFDGSNPRAWLLKRLNYFKLMNTSESERVTIAAMHFEGKAMEWFYRVSQEGRTISWEHFVDLVSNRFGELNETCVFTEFSKLKVKGSLEDYIEKFQELKSHLLMFTKNNYDEAYFIKE